MNGKYVNLITFLVVSCATPAYSQLFSAGIKGGIPASDAYENGSSTGAYERRYVVGPTAEVHFPLHLSFEVDALYRRSGLSYNYTTAVGPFYPTFPATAHDRVNDWQVPFLGKWTPGTGPIRPFLDAGLSYRHVSGQVTQEFYSSPSNPSFESYSQVTNNPNMVGGTFGGGFTFKLAVLRVSPEIRYTRWNSPAFIAGAAKLNPSQVDFLLGLTF